MASAEVLPSSRKQEHLEAGKRRLEEFRKKKAAERAKKAASTTQSYNTDVSLNDKHQLETEQVRAINSDGASTSEGPNPSSLKTVNNNNNKTTEVSRENQQVYSNNAFAVPSFLGSDYNSSTTEVQTHEKRQENEKCGAPWNGGPFSNDSLHTKRFSNDFLEPKSNEDGGSLKVSAVVTPISEDFVTKRSQQNSLQNKASEGSLLGSNHVLSSFHEDSTQSISGIRGSMVSDPGERNFSSSSSGFPSVLGPSTQISGSSEFNFDARGSLSHMPVHSVTDDTISRRSRPSFLDSLNVSKASSGSLFQHDKTTNNAFASHSSQFNSFDTKGSSLFEKPSTEIETMGTFSKLGFPEFPGAREYPGQYLVPVYNDDLLSLNVANENVSEKNHEFYSTKQNEDFAALEQRSVVNQLKSDMEKLQEEIKAQLAELESFKMEYTNARLECNAADERANILASEVIGLEEKVINFLIGALRLRSNELKLERQLENTEAEISSFKYAVIFLYQRACDLHFQDELITCFFNCICLLSYVFKSNCLDYNAHT
ncbi:nuclear distribution nude [Gossypium australe]|uniref:Nuclear distribution nude n=2 Tax=Gossypium TaxID=3633 RepID=A0A5B6UA47_9ROSI|nr:nuclear distribution nude [Gossypium australe]